MNQPDHVVLFCNAEKNAYICGPVRDRRTFNRSRTVDNASQTATSMVDTFLATSSKILEGSGRLSQVGLNAFKQMADSQFDLAAAFAEFGASQFRSLTDIASPKDLLQRQKEASEALGGKLQNYVEQLRTVTQETQQAYVELGRELAADLSPKAA
ncbi:MAG: phasin family protein [Panacagrimonas sp.]